MSENTPINTEPDSAPEQPITEATPTPAENTEAAITSLEDESTIGTGTSMALGCIAGTVVLIIFGLLFLFLSSFI